MNTEQIKLRMRGGFRPFALHLSDGRTFPIAHPEFILVGRGVVAVLRDDDLVEPLDSHVSLSQSTRMNTPMLARRILTPGLALALGVMFAASTALAIPYASAVKRTGDTVTFILNQNAFSVEVLRDGAHPVYPGTNAGPHSFSMAGFTSFQIKVTGNETPGWKLYIPDGTNTSFYVPLGVSINKNPSSPNFGKVYISEGQGGRVAVGYRTTTSGIYLLNADGSDAGWANGGVDWVSAGNSAPFKSTIGPDDHLYVADLSRDLAFEFNDDLSVATQLIDESNRVGLQYVHGLYVEGTRAGGDRRLYLVNGNYNDFTGKGLIRYDLGAEAAVAWGDIGTPILTPAYYSFYPFDVARDSSGDWYLSQYRATAGEAPVLTKFDGAGEVPLDDDIIWEASNEYTYPYGIDLNENTGRVAYGHYSTGEVFFFDMATGAFVEKFDAGNRIRELAFDAAGNLVTVDNLIEWARFWSPGGFTVATTSFDGTQSAFTVFKPAGEVSVTSADTEAAEAGGDSGTFTITRTGDTSAALTVHFALTGTAANGADYPNLSDSVVIPAGANSVDVVITPTDDAEAELTESVILTLVAAPTYSAVPPVSATVTIVDNDTPAADLEVVYPSMYERLSADYARLRVVRRGDTNAPSFEVNLSYAGTAPGARYNAPRSVSVDPGVVYQDFELTPVDDKVLNGDQTIIATVVGGSGYTVGTVSPSAIATIKDDELPPEDVLWSEDFNTDVAADWTVQFGSANGLDDYRIGGYGLTSFSYDYASSVWCPSIPAAPRSASDTLGLYLTVNKDDSTALGAAGINVYPNGKSFSGNYAVRFDMYLMVGDAASTTEYALFGIHHGGAKANWFRNSAGGVPNNPTFDGLFYGIEADGAALGDYVIYSAPTTAGSNPTPLTPGVNASTLTGVFKSGPYNGANFLPGAPGNSETTTNPSWADVEISHVGNVVTLTINRTPIMSYTNTTAFTSGNIMLGYCDAYDSIMGGNSCVIYDNLRVIRLAATTPPNITRIQVLGGNVEIDFAGDAADTPAAFTLQSAGTVNGAYGDVSAAITGSGGSFKAVRALSGAQQFYRIRRS